MITWLKNYLKKESKWSIISNILFFTLIILLLIPTTRMEILPHIQRLLLFAPSPLSANDQTSLTESDFEWQYKNAHGIPTRLSKHEGKVLFINYWATWCPPCIAELPSLVKLHKEYKDKVEFIFLSNEDYILSNDFLANKGFTLKSGQIIYKQPTKLTTSSIPTTFIIDKKGKIILHKQGTARWNSADVTHLLDKLIDE